MGNLTWLCFIIIAATGLTTTSRGPALDAVSREFSLSMSASGILMMLCSAGFLAFSVVGGILSDRYGRKRFLLLALIALAAGSAVAVFWKTSPAIYLSYFLTGLALGGMEGISTTVVAETNPEAQGKIINFSQVFFGVGALAGSLMAGWLCGYGWRWAYMATVPLALVLFFAVRRGYFPSSTVNVPEEKPGERKAFIREPAFLLIALSMLLYVGTEVGVSGWMAYYMQRSLGASLFLASLALSLFWGSMMLGRLISGFLSERMGYERLVMFSSLTGFICLILAMISRSVWTAILLFAAVGLAYSPIWPTLLACAGRRYRSSTGAVFGIIIAAGGLGAIMLPPLIGLFADRTCLA
ncbi:MAG: MFS transporter, partial [bacterium]|nr:MFS transporter [bacterium]